MAMTEQNGCMAYRPTLRMRFWRALGFRFGTYVALTDDDVIETTRHITRTHWDWGDRLRILASGWTEIQIRVDNKRQQVLGVSAAVLLPGTKDEPGMRRFDHSA